MILIIDNYLAGKASIEEAKLLDEWFDNFDTKPSLFSSLSSTEVKDISSKMYLKILEGLNLKTSV